MRFAELQLLAYGRFTDHRLVLDRAATDLHVIHGPNEAGKSTTRDAVAHFLFGFPARAERAAFRHAYKDLRIGARLEDSDDVFQAVRKKGNKNTVLDDAGQADGVAEAALARRLAGVDEAFFKRMFSLDHDSLRAGGRQLAAADTGADSALISAGSGLADIAAERTALVSEADALWAPNPSKHRAYYQAAERLAAADAEIREHAVTVADWQRARDALAAADDHYAELGARRSDLRRQYREIERIRRVAPAVHRYHELGAELDGLADVPDMAHDARPRFDSAREALRQARATEAELRQRIVSIDAELAELIDHPALRDQAEAIERLAGRRAQIADEREREAELARRQRTLAEDLADQRRRLEAAGAILDRNGPEPGAIESARRLAGQRTALAQRVDHVADDLARLAEAEATTTQAVERLGPARDTAALAAWQAAALRNGDLEAEARRTAEHAATYDREIARRMGDLVPAVADVDTLATQRPPERATVDAAEHDLNEARRSRDQLAERMHALAEETTRERDTLARRRADTDLPDGQRLVALRAERDAVWRLVRRRHVEGRGADLFDADDALDAATQRDPAAALERLTGQADALSDARYDAATAIAADAQSARHLAEREQALAQATTRYEAAEQALAERQAAWQAAWTDTGLVPGAPAAMRDWLVERQRLLDARDARDEARTRADGLDTLIAREQAAGRAHLQALGITEPAGAEASLAARVEQARSVIAGQAQRSAEQARLAGDADRQAARRTQLLAQQTQADAALARWQTDWQSALERLGLAVDTPIDDADRLFDALAAGHAHARDLAAHEREQADIVDRRQRFTDDLDAICTAAHFMPAAQALPETTAAELARALASAQRAHQIRTTREADRAADTQRIETQARASAQAHERLAVLAEQAGSADPDTLDTLIARADRRRAASAARAEARETIQRQGDDKPAEALIAAVGASDPDTLAEQIDALDAELGDLDSAIGTARDACNAARGVFDAIGGDERAVLAASARQTALADMSRAAARYLRVGTAARLLKWAGQRYALDKHATLLARSSTLIHRLTGGSVDHLTGEFDDNDELTLVGVRADGTLVPTQAMSEGTLDQLYLALRIAAIEDYLQRAPALPVVADDLFINFDDERAVAGLDALAELAEHTQVLFFTHHAHLRDLAIERLGARVRTHDL